MDASRKLPINEFLKVLQLEYLSYVLRSLIYERPEFIKMSEEIAKKKKEKIENLAKKFRLLSIFDSQEAFALFLNKEFLQEFGLPKIQYGTDVERNKSVSYWDKYYVFREGKKVAYKDKICTILTNNPTEETVSIKYKGEYLVLPYTYVNLTELSSLLSENMKD